MLENIITTAIGSIIASGAVLGLIYFFRHYDLRWPVVRKHP